MESHLPAILTPDLGLLFWMLLAFLVVFIVLGCFAFPVITKMVESRKKYIDDSLQKAHDANEKLAHITQQSEQMLTEARERSSQIVKDATATRDGIIAQAQDKAREESSRIISEAKAQIENEKQAALQQIRNEVATLSVSIASKILREKLSDDADQMKYVEKLLDEISSQNK